MPHKPASERGTAPKQEANAVPVEPTELSPAELDRVSGGGLKKLPGKRNPPTITLK